MKIAIILGSVLLIGVAIYLYLQYRKRKAAEEAESQGQSTPRVMSESNPAVAMEAGRTAVISEAFQSKTRRGLFGRRGGQSRPRVFAGFRR